MTLLQKAEIRKGTENELSPEAVAVYSNHTLNYLQMASLRQALESGIETDQVKRIAKRWIPYWQMEEYAEELRNGTVPVLPHRPFPLKQVLSAGVLAVCILPLILFADIPEKGVLELTGDEVRLACGMEFDPAAYVKTYEGENASLILPEAFTAERPEVRLASYRLKSEAGMIQKILRVRIVDETAPEIKLKTEKTELLKEAPFACREYVLSAEDNVDHDLTNAVSCSNILEDTESQKVEYTVQDQAGNQAHAYLLVHYADYEETAETETAVSAAAPVHSAPAVQRPAAEVFIAAEPSALSEPTIQEEIILPEEEPLLQ